MIWVYLISVVLGLAAGFAGGLIARSVRLPSRVLTPNQADAAMPG